MRVLLAGLAAAAIAGALLAAPAEARCWRNGAQWHCTHSTPHHRYRLPDPSWGY